MSSNPGKYKEVDIRDIISSAKMDLNLDTMDNDLYFLKLANEAIRSLNTLSIFKKQKCCLPICDGKAELPNGFNQFIALCFCDESGNVNGQQVYIDNVFLNNNGCGVPNNISQNIFINYSGIFEIVGNYIIFGNQTTAEYCNLIYFGLNVSENGLMMVYDYYERAITAYVCWKYALQNFKDYPQYIIESYQKQWNKQKQFIIGTDAQDFARNNMWQLKRIFNAWMLNQNSQEFNFNSLVQ